MINEFVRLLIVCNDCESIPLVDVEPRIFASKYPNITIQSKTINDETEIIKYFCPDFDLDFLEIDIITLSVKLTEGESSRNCIKFE